MLRATVNEGAPQLVLVRGGASGRTPQEVAQGIVARLGARQAGLYLMAITRRRLCIVDIATGLPSWRLRPLARPPRGSFRHRPDRSPLL